MLGRLNERLGLPDGSFAPIGVEAIAGRQTDTRHRPPRRVPPRGRAARLALRGRRGHPGKAAPPAPPPEHGLRDLPARQRRRTGRRGPRPGAARPAPAAAARSLPLARRAGELAPPWSVPFHRLGRPLRDLVRAGHPAAADHPGRPRSGVHPRRRGDDADHLPAGGPARLRIDGRLVEPRILPGRADAGRADDADRLGRVVGDLARPHARGG